MWKWKEGRIEEVQYYKFKLFEFKIHKWDIGFDCYLMKYPKRIVLPLHKDEVSNGKHYRANLTLWGDSAFNIEGKSIVSTILLKVFRPDLYEHSLITTTTTYKLSLGWVKFKT